MINYDAPSENVSPEVRSLASRFEDAVIAGDMVEAEQITKTLLKKFWVLITGYTTHAGDAVIHVEGLPRTGGQWKDQVDIKEDFDELPPDMQEAFGMTEIAGVPMKNGKVERLED